MKRTATLGLLAFLSILSAFSQGTILFNNRVVGKVDAPVGYFGSSYGPGPVGRAQLVMVLENEEIPLFPITTFRENSTNLPSYVGMYVVEPSVPVIVPGYRPGDEVTVRLRAWYCSADYDGAGGKGLGASNAIKIILGGTNMNGSVTPPAPLVGLQGFQLTIIRPRARINSVSIENDTLLLDTSGSAPYYRRYILEATANFVQWEQITTNWYECAPITFRIPLFGANDTQTFYRLNAD